MTRKNKESQEQMQSQPRFADYHKSAGNLLWLLLLGVLSYVAYQYNIVLFLVFALLPFWLISKSKKISKKAKLWRNCWLSFFMWFIVNAIILKQEKVMFALPDVNMIVSFSNALIVTWVNFVIFVMWGYTFFYSFLKDKTELNLEKQIYFISTTIVFSVLMVIYSQANVYHIKNFEYISLLAAFFASIIYTILIGRIFPKKICYMINLFLSMSFIVIFVTGLIIIYGYVGFYIPEKGRPIGFADLQYLVYFQIVSFSSIILYFLPQKYFTKKPHFHGWEMVLLCGLLSVGICLQQLWLVSL